MRKNTCALGTRESNGPGDFEHANAGPVRCGYPKNNLLTALIKDNYAGLHCCITCTFDLRDGC